MARITKAQLQAQLAALQADNDALRTQLNAANARIERGHQLLRQLKAEHLEHVRQSQLVIDHYTQQSVAQPTPTERPVAQPGVRVTRFARGGHMWEKHRVGNRATEYCLGRVALN